MSNICAGIGRGQMTVVNDHIAHHRHIQNLYLQAFANVNGIHVHTAPDARYQSNYWLCTILLDPSLHVQGQEYAYKQQTQKAIGGVGSLVHKAATKVTDCQPNDNVEAMRTFLDEKGIEARPLWKPMHKQPVFRNAPAYTNGVSESIFKVGLCLPSGPMVTDDDVKYIVESIKKAIVA